MRPLAIDLFCGLGGWSEALLGAGWDVVGFDIERHEYAMPDEQPANGSKGTKPVEKRGWTQGCAISLGLEGGAKRPLTRLASYPAHLVLQDVRTLHGAQFRNASLIVASPPCQQFSYRAQPWKIARALSPEECGQPEPAWWNLPQYVPPAKRKPNHKPCMTMEQMEEWAEWRTKYPKPLPLLGLELFWQCWRIQHEASEAKGEYIPMIVENVVGAQRWVGRAAWHHRSFYLWGDVPPLMPIPSGKVLKEGVAHRSNGETNFHGSAARAKQTDGTKAPDQDGYVRDHPAAFGWKAPRSSSRSSARKAASAMIAKIPPALASHIAQVFLP